MILLSEARPQRKKGGGFYLWSKLLANKWHEPVSNIVNDKSYNYRAYYNENLIDAYKHLIGQGHFPDTYKTVYHPTFSIESRYSGYKNKYNPNGITGGRWFDANTPVGQQNIYQFSSSQLNNNWNIDRTLQYIDNAEDNGVLPLLPNGRMLHLDGTLYGGVLPSVIVRPSYKTGGDIKSTANNKKMYHGARHNYYDSYYNDMIDEDGNPLAFNYYDKDGRAHYINKATGETYTSYKGNYDEGGVTIKPSTYRSSYDPNGVTDFMNIATLGALNRLSLSQNLGIIKDVANNRNAMDIINRSMLGNDGIFSNPNYNLALDIIGPTLAYNTYKLPSLLRNYSLGIPNKTGRYFRIVGNASTPQGDAIADANATGIIRSNAKKVNVGQSKSGRRFTFGKEYSYPMFSKDKVWQGSTGIGESLGKTDRIIRTKADTGPTVWEESRIDFNHKNHAGIFRPNYLGDINAFPTRYAEWWERIGNNPITRHIWRRHDFDNVEFRNGGSIHINPANRGKFTATM